MRGDPIRVLTALLLAGALGLAPAGARGQRAQPELALRIAIPNGLTAGAAAMVDVFVRLPRGPEQPLLLTPVSEGEAVRVVRGRLLRADARRTTQGELHFQVPIEARAAGTAVLRISLLTYVCALRCRAVRAVETRTLQVAGG